MHRFWLTILAATSLALGACGETTGPALTGRVVSVVPAGGATGVDHNAAIVVIFSHAMRSGMEQYAALHEGDVRGPIVAGTWMWSTDRTVLTFTPAPPLKAQTQYSLHLGGGMRDTDGGFVDYGPCVGQYGGQWATHGLMGGGMMGGNMMGEGWRHPNGTYGMVFTFTTS